MNNNLQGEGKEDSVEGVCEWERERKKTVAVGIGIWKCIIVEYLKFMYYIFYDDLFMGSKMHYEIVYIR